MYSNFKSKSDKMPMWQYVLVVALAIGVLFCALFCTWGRTDKKVVTAKAEQFDDETRTFVSNYYDFYITSFSYNPSYGSVLPTSVDFSSSTPFRFRTSFIVRHSGSWFSPSYTFGDKYFPSYYVAYNGRPYTTAHIAPLRNGVDGILYYPNYSDFVPLEGLNIDTLVVSGSYYDGAFIGGFVVSNQAPNVSSFPPFSIYFVYVDEGFDMDYISVVKTSFESTFGDSVNYRALQYFDDENIYFNTVTLVDMNQSTFRFASLIRLSSSSLLPVFSMPSSVYSLPFGYDSKKEYNLGYQEGSIAGRELGEKIGYDHGYSEGRAQGYKQGESYGYNQGLQDANQYTFLGLITSVVDAPLQVFSTMFDFEILGINMKSFFLSLLTACIILTIFKLVL